MLQNSGDDPGSLVRRHLFDRVAFRRERALEEGVHLLCEVLALGVDFWVVSVHGLSGLVGEEVGELVQFELGFADLEMQLF